MTEEKSGGLSAKKGCVWIATGLVLLVGFGALLGGLGDVSDPNGPTNSGQSAPVEELVVTARELAQAYDDNEAAAQQKYGDKPLVVTGIITGITLDILNDPVVQLAGINQFLPVQGKLADKAVAAKLKKGQKVSLRCEGVREVLSMPHLKECRL